MGKKQTCPKNLRTYVGKKDVKGAKRCNNEDCPLARSLRRRFSKNWLVRVSDDGDVQLTNYRTGTYVLYNYSKDARRKIRRYDQKKRFETGHIRLRKVY